MDPEAVLKKARAAASRIMRAAGGYDASDMEYAFDLAEAFEALDEWLSKGGFPPSDWAKKGEN